MEGGKGGIIINGILRGETLAGPQSCLCPVLARFFENTRLHVSGNRQKCCKTKNARPHNHCSPSTLFIQDSTIKEECQSVAPQTYHNQSKISNHLGRLYLLYFFETLENLLVLLMSASFFSPSLLLVTFLQGGLFTATASVLPMADVWMKLSARR